MASQKEKTLRLGAPTDQMTEGVSEAYLAEQYGILAFWAVKIMPGCTDGPRMKACQEIIANNLHLNSGLKMKGGAAA